jgi:hypothetical protein
MTFPNDKTHSEPSEKDFNGQDVSFDSSEVDEALQLVGTRRTAQFSEEYNQRLRRKLVCAIHLPSILKLTDVLRIFY